MALLDGKQLKDAPNGIATAKINANAVTAAKVDASIVVAAGTNAFTGDQSLGGFKLTNLGAPASASDAARLADVTAAQQGLTTKGACRLATAAALPANTFAAGPGTLTMNAVGALTVDGQVVANGDRVLVKNEAAGLRHGIYTQTQLGTGAAVAILTRATDYDITSEIHEGDTTYIAEGTTNVNTSWAQTTPAPVLNTSALVFTQNGGGTSFATPTVAADALAATGGSAGTAIRSDAKLQVMTAAQTVTVKSDAATATTGTATSLLRTDAQQTVATASPANLGTGLAAGTSTSLARADHVHAAAKATPADKNLTASATAADNAQATASTVTAAPVVGCDVGVRVNGVHQLVGNGTKTAVDCYFSGDNGVTARAFGSIAATDKLFWNGSVAGFQLAATDKIDLVYDTF